MFVATTTAALLLTVTAPITTPGGIAANHHYLSVWIADLCQYVNDPLPEYGDLIILKFVKILQTFLMDKSRHQFPSLHKFNFDNDLGSYITVSLYPMATILSLDLLHNDLHRTIVKKAHLTCLHCYSRE